MSYKRVQTYIQSKTNKNKQKMSKASKKKSTSKSVEQVVFGNPTNDLLLRAQKLIGPDETILGVVRNSKKNCQGKKK